MAVASEARERVIPCVEVDGVLYPIVEEEPVVQGSWHFTTAKELANMVEGLLADRPEAGIFGDILVYWRQGEPRKRVAPDLIVFPAIDQPKAERKSLFLWREKTRPVFVMEVLSDENDGASLRDKMAVYQDEMAIPEFFLCDPRLRPMEVWGYRLREGKYERVVPDASGRLWSESLSAWFGVDEEGDVQVWDAQGRALPRYAQALARAEEEARRAEEEARRAEEEARLRLAAEARVRELEEKLRERGG